MATTRKKTTTPERSEAAAPQAASRAAGRTSTARTTSARSAERAPPTWESVSRRAFEIWQEAGQPNGHDLEHWLQAETELRGK
jgi:hypothetical protein